MKHHSAAGEPRILIVDDHRISRRFMVAALRQSAVTVKQARNAGEALAVALSWLPHVILLDVRLGDNDGFDTARKIQQCWPAARPQPRVVMLSADQPAVSQWQVAAALTHGFLLKPFSAQQLLAAITQQLPEAPDQNRHDVSPSQLQQLFRDELGRRLGTLDGCLAKPDLAAATAILHQLIAASAMCQQRQLERDLRALHAACANNAGVGSLARGYFALLMSAREYLVNPHTAV